LLQGFFGTRPNVAHPALASLLRKRPVEIRHGLQRSLPPWPGDQTANLSVVAFYYDLLGIDSQAIKNLP
jgi:hypothetical protein